MSYESLTSFEAREKLRNLKQTDPIFWNELTMERPQLLPEEDEEVDEDKIPKPDDVDWGWDDSDIPINTAVGTIVSGDYPIGVAERLEGGLMSVVQAEDLDLDLEEISKQNFVEEDEFDVNGVEKAGAAEKPQGRGRREKKANKLYDSKVFWKH